MISIETNGLWSKFRLIFSPSFWFVAVNGFCAAGNIVQYMLFMRFFDFRELGTITLLHTIITLTGMAQCGLLNGGFRIFSQNTPALEPRVNNTVFSFFWTLLLISLPLPVIGFLIGRTAQWSFLWLGIVIGVANLMKNWLTNINIARKTLTRLNWVNFLTTLFAFVFFLLIPRFGLTGGIFVVAATPTAFCVFFLLCHSEFRPKCFSLKKRTVLWILYFGLLPFLTGILTQLNLEIGNLGITWGLGKAALGKFTLVQIYTTCYMLVPGTLTILFLPRLLPAFKSGDQPLATRFCRLYTFFLTCYTVLAAVGTLTAFPWLVSMWFPKYSIALPFVYIVLPGLILMTLTMPIGMMLYINLVLRPVFHIYLFSIGLTAAGIAVMLGMGNMTLYGMAALKCLVSVFIAFMLVVCHFRHRKTMRVVFSLF